MCPTLPCVVMLVVFVSAQSLHLVERLQRYPLVCQPGGRLMVLCVWGGASAGGARVEMGERGVCRGISLLYQCFSSLFCSPLRGELAILLLQRNINKIFTRLWLFIYSLSGLVTQARAGCCDREESVTTPTSISGTGSLGSRTAAGL